MTTSKAYGDLARAWWSVYGPNGTIANIDDWTTEVTDQVVEVDRAVDALSNDYDSLRPIVDRFGRSCAA